MLLNPHRLFDADWHGMGVHVLWKEEGVEVRLTFQTVADPLRASWNKRRGNVGVRPHILDQLIPR